MPLLQHLISNVDDTIMILVFLSVYYIIIVIVFVMCMYKGGIF